MFCHHYMWMTGTKLKCWKDHFSRPPLCFLALAVMDSGIRFPGYPWEGHFSFESERIEVLEGWAFPVRCTAPCRFAMLHLEWTKTTKTYVDCLPTPALCLHHVFHVGRSSQEISVWRMGCYWAWEEGGSVLLCSSGCPGGWVLAFGAVFPVVFGLMFPSSHSALSFHADYGNGFCRLSGPRGSSWARAAHRLLCIISPGRCSSGKHFLWCGWRTSYPVITSWDSSAFPTKPIR